MAAGLRAFKPSRRAPFRSAAQPPPQLPPPVSVVRTAPSRKILESETTALVKEYEEVLRRPKYKFGEQDIATVLLAAPCRFRTIGRNRDLVPRTAFPRLSLARREVWYPLWVPNRPSCPSVNTSGAESKDFGNILGRASSSRKLPSNKLRGLAFEESDDLVAVVSVAFAVDAAQVRLHRGFRDEERILDVLQAVARHPQTEDLALAGR